MFSARTEKGPVTPRIVNGWIENLHGQRILDRKITTTLRIHTIVETQWFDLQAENDTAQSSTEDYLNRAPWLPCQFIQIAGESDARQEVCEKHIYSRSHDELVKDSPIGHVAIAKIAQVLTEEPKGLEAFGKAHRR